MTGRRKSRQLFQLATPEFNMPVLTDMDGALIVSPADYLPLVYWPDGSWCIEANRYIRSLYEHGASRTNKGGTLKQIASQISPLLRYCWSHKLPLQDLTDEDFSRFILSITPTAQATKQSRKAPKAKSSYVRNIGRKCLAMLKNMADHANDPGFIGPNGQIRGFEKRVTYRSSRGGVERKRSRLVLHHASLPTGSVKKSRRPVTSREIQALREAAEAVAAELLESGRKRRKLALFVLQRRLLCIRVLESAPPRRGEVASLRVSAIRRAATMSEPSLEMTLLKGGAETTREVPVTRSLVRALLNFDEMERQPLLNRLKMADHDFLFVSAVTGEPLDWDSITQDIRFLARRAGLPHAVTPHMFRHRFITKLFVDLIQLHDLKDEDSLRRLLLSSEDLLIKVKEWTGHRSIDSLRVYIHEAFHVVSGLKRSLDLVRLKLAVESLASSIEDDLRLARMGGLRTRQMLLRVQTQLDQFNRDITWAELQEEASDLVRPQPAGVSQ